MRNSNLTLLFALLITLLIGAYFMDFFSSSGPAVPGKNAVLEDSTKLEQAQLKEPGDSELAGRTEAVDDSKLEIVETEEIAAAKTVQVQIFDEYNQPISNARVIPWVGEKFMQDGRTDAAGLVELHDLQGVGGFVIQHQDWYPQFVQQVFDQDEISVHLLAAGVIGGRVTFAGSRVPTKSFEIRLFTLPEIHPQGFPMGLVEELAKLGLKWNDTNIHVGTNFEFRLHGLPEGWAGRMKMPYGMMIKSFDGPGSLFEGSFIDLRGLSEQMVIEVVKLPSFSGRVVKADTDEGLEGVHMTFVRYNEDKTNSSVGFARSEKEGYFRADLFAADEEEIAGWCRDPDSISIYHVGLDINDIPGWAGGWFEIDLRDSADPWNLGDFPMHAQVVQAFHVSDENGRPMKGAVAFTRTLSKPTDAMGDGVAMLRANETEVVVAAPGYESVHKTSDQAIDGVLNFELTTSASMQVFWSPPAEMDDSVNLRLRSDGHLFADESPAASKLRREFGAPLMAWAKMPPADGSRGGLINWPLKKSQKEFLIRGLAVNETLEIQIVGRLGHVLSASPPFTLGHGESRQITLPPFAPSVELRGQVVDVDGNALSNAEVGLRAEQKRTFTYTDANGRFRFGSLSPITVDLSVKAAGFESYSLKSVEISAGRAPLQITLKPTE